MIKSRIIGKVGEIGLKDGNFEEAKFYNPKTIFFLSKIPIGFLFEHGNHNGIRIIDFGKERVNTIAGNKEANQNHESFLCFHCLFSELYGMGAIHKNQKLLFVSDSGRHVIKQIDISSIYQQYELLGDLNKQLEVTDSNNHISESNLLVSNVCGAPRQQGFKDGIGDKAKLNNPSGITFSQLNENILYFCDTDNRCIRKVNILTKQVSTIAGIPNQWGTKDGIGNQAQFAYPTGICVDKNENLFVCDYGNHSIRKINFNSIENQPNQNQVKVSTIFGNQINRGMKDGNKSMATLKYPICILFDRISNCLLFTQEHSIRQIKLGKNFLEWKLKRTFLIYRILFKQCEKSISKKLLLQLISIQILQISNEEDNGNKIMIEKQNKLIEYIKTNSTQSKLDLIKCLVLEREKTKNN